MLLNCTIILFLILTDGIFLSLIPLNLNPKRGPKESKLNIFVLINQKDKYNSSKREVGISHKSK